MIGIISFIEKQLQIYFPVSYSGYFLASLVFWMLRFRFIDPFITINFKWSNYIDSLYGDVQKKFWLFPGFHVPVIFQPVWCFWVAVRTCSWRSCSTNVFPGGLWFPVRFLSSPFRPELRDPKCGIGFREFDLKNQW